ncbi:conserved hypothetical protein [Talaromyces stipitatus ATCC 10500]|uniref:Uncharacterized protein n=1 Tax=Talaromyces stipitatus (strain ATCC 10500 / CBS 375.48 / QM 6759 / NRRL 1006) TaxID=441959 RepID=B8LX25_TALSN|nr:uncharacterized protein TSTA_061630 [Talaromyces stipitatus ATCC 10500]EED22675.1 conserved hypothetical protein [Talaromyces stipitatus ATCC 10500]
MPPIRNKNEKNLAEQEGRMLLAISDLKNGKISSVYQAAIIYNIPRTTLYDRGITCQMGTRSRQTWITPRHSLVREMANYLLSQRGNQQVGEKWVYNLIQRRPEIESKFSRKYNYERAKCEDPKLIQEYFDRVREVISKYGILPEDIYNFDETGFAMGLCATAKVITGSDRYARPKLLQPGNREWVTAIEAINSTGWALPSYIIFKQRNILG